MITYLMQDLTVAQRVSEKVNYALNMHFDRCIGTMRDNELVFGAVYANYNGHSCQVHIAAFRKYWLTRDMLFVYFYYPFIQLNCHRMFATVPESNDKALEFDKRVGFKYETLLKDVYTGGEGMHILSMARSECRWLKREPPEIPLYKLPTNVLEPTMARH
jgi:RimJ/RimL family protein N-acetyltransferase